MGRVVVLIYRTIQVAIGIEFVGEHVADARCRTTGAAILIEYWREEFQFSIVHVCGSLGTNARCFGRTFDNHQRRVGMEFPSEVWVLLPIDFLCHQKCWHCHCKPAEGHSA